MGFSQFWQHCWFDTAKGQDRCRIYGGRGDILSDDVFFPIDGKGAALPSDQLTISSGGNSYTVHLRNGAVLIPRQNFDEIRRELNGDFSNAK
jgi:hypothetical protein